MSRLKFPDAAQAKYYMVTFGSFRIWNPHGVKTCGIDGYKLLCTYYMCADNYVAQTGSHWTQMSQTK